MAFEYTKTAKDTKYNGVLFRSRLEATWAAFFDLCGIKWVYEPFDLPGWSPDFLIAETIVVEVKPFTKPDSEIADKMLNAAISGLNNNYTLLMLGVSPASNRTLGWYPFTARERCGQCDKCNPVVVCNYEFPGESEQYGTCRNSFNETHIGVSWFCGAEPEMLLFSAIDADGDFQDLGSEGMLWRSSYFQVSSHVEANVEGKFTRGIHFDNRRRLIETFNTAKNQVRFTVRNKQNR